MLNNNELNYYNQIKKELINNEIEKKVKDYSKNKKELDRYINVGELLFLAQGGEERAKYGDQLIKKYSTLLTKELGKGYSTRTLHLMMKFYQFQKVQALPAQFMKLSWSHICELLSLKDINEINYYIDIVAKQNLSYRKLHGLIKQKEYQRLPNSTKNKLITKQETTVSDYIKDPIIINNPLNKEVIKEKILQELILNDIDNFLNQLGSGFTYVGHEYKINMGNTYNYIDLLLFNYIYNCFIVVELKVTELKKEHYGQIKFYMNYIDENIKTNNNNDTIGIIITKKFNKYIIKYSSDERIITTKYITI